MELEVVECEICDTDEDYLTFCNVFVGYNVKNELYLINDYFSM